MPAPTPAQEEFAHFLAKNNADHHSELHPEDRETSRTANSGSEDEEDRYRKNQIDAAMRVSMFDSRPNGSLNLPPASFDAGRTTGVKGVIADARAYENARRTRWKDRVRAARRSVFGMDGLNGTGNANDRSSSGPESDGSAAEDHEEETFLQQWRESRKRELEADSRNGAIRNRRTSPSVRMYGRLDEVDALGYLDAIEKVGRETVVVVFVHDRASEVSSQVEQALQPLVGLYPAVHFVKVHYEDIDFDNAGVPAVLAYKNQGDLFANLTGLIDLLPDHEDLEPDALKRLFQKHSIV